MPSPFLRIVILGGMAAGLWLGGCTLINEYPPLPEDGTGGAGGGTGGGAVGGAGGGSTDECEVDADCDDDNDCTLDSCDGGACTHEPAAEGDPCTQGEGQGTCDASGSCVVSCTMEGDPVCDDDNDCTLDSCNVDLGKCENDPLDGVPPVPDPNVDQDCKVIVCVEGQVEEQVDPSDVYDDGLECTKDECTADGEVQNPPLPKDTPCGANGDLLCDGAGNCANCNSDSDCTDNDPCRDSVCENAVCVLTDEPQGTACDDGVFCNGTDSCDGNGGCTVHANAPCDGVDGDGDCSELCDETNDSCTQNDPNGSPCNDGQFCTQTDTCSNGSCTGSGDPCTGPDGDGDCSESCSESGNSCTANDPNGSSCNDGQFCTQTDTCSSGSCTGSGDPCTGPDGDGDCSESCNESSNDCTANDPDGSACDDGLFCNGDDTCSSGSCSVHGTYPCPGPDGDSDCTEMCDEDNDDCSANDPNGVSCGPNSCCSNGSCLDSSMTICLK